jgi:hypothetical protein
MPRRDIYHDIVVAALIADGWVITDDPLYLAYGGRDMYADLAAERPIGAEKAGQKIAVEIKSFVEPSDVHELTVAIGQFNSLSRYPEHDRANAGAVPGCSAANCTRDPERTARSTCTGATTIARIGLR